MALSVALTQASSKHHRLSKIKMPSRHAYSTGIEVFRKGEHWSQPAWPNGGAPAQ